MSRSELISSLYANFAALHRFWMKCFRRRGVGALMFFPEDYESARDFEEVQLHFWEQEQLLEYLKDQTKGTEVLRPEDVEFLSRVNSNEFLSVVVRHDDERRLEVEIHRIDRALLN